MLGLEGWEIRFRDRNRVRVMCQGVGVMVRVKGDRNRE